MHYSSKHGFPNFTIYIYICTSTPILSILSINRSLLNQPLFIKEFLTHSTYKCIKRGPAMLFSTCMSVVQLKHILLTFIYIFIMHEREREREFEMRDPEWRDKGNSVTFSMYVSIWIKFIYGFCHYARVFSHSSAGLKTNCRGSQPLDTS
jgi:hypothetical protein